MGALKRGIIFFAGTLSNGLLFLFHSRVVLEVLDYAGQGPATGAMNMLPDAMVLAMGGLQIGLIVYLLGGFGKERAATRRMMP